MSRRSRAALRRASGFAVVAVVALGLGACRQDMHDQPKVEALEKSAFFGDGRGARRPPANTVARGGLREDEVFHSGFLPNDELVPTIPMEVTARTLERGRDTFNTFCATCHDQGGTGRGMIVRRGFPQPPTYHQERLRSVPDGYIFDVITNGFGRMPSYAGQIPVEDRWAVVAYVRALQLSQHAPVDELPSEMVEKARETGYLPPEIEEVEDVRGNPQAPPGFRDGATADASTDGTD